MLGKRCGYRTCVFGAMVFVAALVQAVAQIAPVGSRIGLPVNDAVWVKIPNSTHPMAQPAYEVGPLDGATALERIILLLNGSADQQYQARTLLDSQQTKGSPDYHHWLTPEEYGQRFGPSTQDIAQVTGWLQQHGFTIGSVAKSGLWLEFSGTSAQVEAAFQTQMHQYLVNGELHVANANNISIPAALAPVVQGMLSLHNFYSQPTLRRSSTMGPVTVDPAKPNFTDSNGDHFLTPGDVATIYDLNPLYNGSTTAGTINGAGQTIALVAAGNINLSDVSAFQSMFGLPQKAPNIILNGPDPGLDDASDVASVDVEYSGGVAPGATIDLVVSGGTLTTDPVALSASYIVDQNLAPVVSVSFATCEQNLGSGSNGNPFWNAVWEQAAAQGISVFVASGDTGAAGCDPLGVPNAQDGLGVNGLASTPFDTAVGGSEFNETPGITYWSSTNSANMASAIGYIPEVVWNENCLVNFACLSQGIPLQASGGGVSTLYSVPSYQTLNIEGLAGAGFPERPVPDVSLNAGDAYIFCFTPPSTIAACDGSGGFNGVSSLGGGTEFATAEFAGIMALVDQAAGGRQGLANYGLYALAAKESASFSSCNSSNQTNPAVPPGPACVFNDITFGTNGVPGNDTLSGGAFVPPGDGAGQLGYNAFAGYDPASGLGSVNAAALVNAWVTLASGFDGSATALTSTSGTSINITHGAPVTFTSTVTNLSGSTPTPSGEISLVAQGGNLPGNAGITAAALSGTGAAATTGSFTVNNLPGGTNYNVVANFPGDGIVGGSTSSALTATVSPEATTTILQSFVFNDFLRTFAPGNTTDYGDGVNLLVIDADNAGVSGLVPSSGSVTFAFNGVSVPAIAIDNSGIAEITSCNAPLTPCLPPGTYTVTATYNGDGLSYQPNNATPISITITKGNPVPRVLAPTPVSPGETFTLGVELFIGLGPIVPTGTVQFLDNGAALGGPLTLNAGQASMPVTFANLGTNSITVQYSGDSTYNAATSSPYVIVSETVPFELGSFQTSQTIAPGETANFTVELADLGGFSGTVNLTCSGAPAGYMCTVTPNTTPLIPNGFSVPLTVTVAPNANGRLRPAPFRGLPFVFAGFMAAVIVCIRRRPKHRILLLLGALLVAGMISCGGGGSTPTPTPTGQTSVLTVTATSGALSTSITLNLTIN